MSATFGRRVFPCLAASALLAAGCGVDAGGTLCATCVAADAARGDDASMRRARDAGERDATLDGKQGLDASSDRRPAGDSAARDATSMDGAQESEPPPDVAMVTDGPTDSHEAAACMTACSLGASCTSDLQCASGNCPKTGLMPFHCAPHACAPDCDAGSACTASNQCRSQSCVAGACVPPTCSPHCHDGDPCGANTDCATQTCTQSLAGSFECAAPPCTPDCTDGTPCDDGSQCGQGNCIGSRCTM